MAHTGEAAAVGAAARSAMNRRDRRLRALITLLAGVAVWLFTHRYVGIPGDARLYQMLAMNWAQPGVFGSDLAVMHGSQDSFTLFSPLYGALIRWFGLPEANIGLLLVTYALWLAGAWRLAHRLVRGLPGHVAFLMMCALRAGYGGWSLFYAGENYLTARPLAEALVLLGLAALISRAPVRATALMALALVVHPLMALAGAGAEFFTLAARRRALLWCVPVGCATGLALALCGVDPFGRLMTRIDSAWFAAIGGGFAFAHAWKPEDWTSLAVDLAICMAAIAWSKGMRRRLYMAVVVTAVAGVSLALVGGDIGRSALIIPLQPWRCAWLLGVIKLPALVLLWLRLRRRRLGLAAWALLAAPVFILTPQFASLAWAPALAMCVAGGALTFLVRINRQPRVSNTVARLLVEAAAVLPLANLGAGLIYLWLDARFWLQNHASIVDEAALLPVRLGLLAIAVALCLMARRRAGAVMIVSSFLVVASVLAWDARTPWERYVSGAHLLPLAGELPERAQILWGASAADTWFLLRRPAYVSLTQSSVLLMSRSTALEWDRRAAWVGPVLPLSGQVTSCADSEPAPLLAHVALVCHRAAGLYGVIVDSPAPGGLSFTTPAKRVSLCYSGPRVGARSIDRFYFLPCSQFTDKGPGTLGGPA
jgi:hypothetical protein